jgi:hypothetical protein
MGLKTGSNNWQSRFRAHFSRAHEHARMDADFLAACQFNTTPETVAKWVKRFERLVKVSDLTRPRAPPTCSRQVEGEMQ